MRRMKNDRQEKRASSRSRAGWYLRAIKKETANWTRRTLEVRRLLGGEGEIRTFGTGSGDAGVLGFVRPLGERQQASQITVACNLATPQSAH